MTEYPSSPFVNLLTVVHLRFRDSGIQGFRDSGIQGFRDSGIQGFRDSGIQGFY
jgi:hypothetical protein